jgi:hypothetical protein
LHRVDELTWEPGWVEVLDDEQRRRMASICAGEQWILDAAYGKWPTVVRLTSAAQTRTWLTRIGTRG